jgi:Glycosyl hydrolase family 12
MRYGLPASLTNILLGVVAAAVPVGVPAVMPTTNLAHQAATAPAAHPTAPATHATYSWMCRPWQALRVTGTNGQHFVIRNKPSINHNGQGMCIAPRAGAAFVVTRSPGVGRSQKVRAYPYIATGCFERACAAGGNGYMPRVSALGNYTVSWATVQPPHSGYWNASLDLWLGPRPGVGTSEIMVWLRYSGPSWWARRYPSVWVDGAKWYLVPHATGPGRHYISFRRASPVKAASLRLAPFMAVAERLGDLNASAFLWCVQAGFEIFSGGKGLAITRFSISK